MTAEQVNGFTLDFPLVQGAPATGAWTAPPRFRSVQNKTGTLALTVLYVDNRDALGWTLGKAGPLSV
jgi:hypothetical protein